MLLLTCATHLMSMSIVRNYWRNLWQSTLRVILIFGIVLVTGLFLSNQDADTETKFPTGIPPSNETSIGFLFLPAACYQKGKDAQLSNEMQDTFHDTGSFKKAIFQSTTGNKIQGWNYYLIMLIWYVLALLVTYVRRFYYIYREYGFWVAAGKSFIPICCSGWDAGRQHVMNNKRHEKFFKWLHVTYMVLGVVIGSTIAITSAKFIMSLRSWVRKSRWLEQDSTSLGAEDNATSFGQQVPILLTFLTVFTAAQTVNGKSHLLLPISHTSL